MSHFAVLVATKTAHKGELNDLLAPYHEYECTGEQDRYVQAHSELSTYQDGYAQDTVNMAKKGDEFKDLYEGNFFFRPAKPEELEAINEGFKANRFASEVLAKLNGEKRVHVRKTRSGSFEVHDLGDWELVSVPVREHMSLLEYIQSRWTDCPIVDSEIAKTLRENIASGIEVDEEYKWGWIEYNKDGEVVDVIDVTNENSKWDWWTEGGRWSGFLVNKNGERVNSCQVKDLDIAGLREKYGKQAAESYDKVRSITGDANWVSWREVVEKNPNADWGERRKIYREQEAVKAHQEAVSAIYARPDYKDADYPFLRFDLDDFLLTREQFIERVTKSTFLTNSYLDGLVPDLSVEDRWQGNDMGMFGCVLREEENWETKFSNWLDSLPEDAYLTVVDCHC